MAHLKKMKNESAISRQTDVQQKKNEGPSTLLASFIFMCLIICFYLKPYCLKHSWAQITSTVALIATYVITKICYFELDLLSCAYYLISKCIQKFSGDK